MATAKAATEPSMEEILASIRKIIADEDTSMPEPQKANDQSAIDDAFAAADADEEMSADDVDALFDSPTPAAEEELDQSAIDAAFDSVDGEEMSSDDVDALFDSAGSGEDEDVLTLSPAQAVGARDDLSFDHVEMPAPTAPKAKPVAPARPMATRPATAEPPLVSSMTASAVQSSFGALNSAMNMSSSNTLEDVVKGMMRPMVKQWLDDNLPAMVERLVQAEIERMRNP
mgnify:CR=1 FL=1